jgi:hypothetical protein
LNKILILVCIPGSKFILCVTARRTAAHQATLYGLRMSGEVIATIWEAMKSDVPDNIQDNIRGMKIRGGKKQNMFLMVLRYE